MSKPGLRSQTGGWIHISTLSHVNVDTLFSFSKPLFYHLENMKLLPKAKICGITYKERGGAATCTENYAECFINH